VASDKRFSPGFALYTVNGHKWLKVFLPL
jgi:hypothetical protein